MARSAGRCFLRSVAAVVMFCVGVCSLLATIGTVFARRILTPAAPDAQVRVWSLEQRRREDTSELRVWLSGPDAELPGRYSFLFEDGAGHARLGPVIDRLRMRGVDRVARVVETVDRGRLREGVTGRITGWWYVDPRELGSPAERISFPMQNGHSWAWLVRPRKVIPGHWAIHVHGRGAHPEETLRGLGVCNRLGLTSLVISYRNDPGAPAGAHGRYGLGLAERYDVDAAIAWARSHGAEHVTLFGWSMGGTTVLLTATRGEHRECINGLILDSPGVDWRGILLRQGQLANVPRVAARLGLHFLRQGWVRGAVPGRRGTDIAALTPDAFARDLNVPTLIHASPGDSFVPWDGSVRLARLRPDLVRLRACTGEHVRIWNVDPVEWDRQTESFVRDLLVEHDNI